MTWNYRVVRDTHTLRDDEYESFTIRECYYDDAGKVTSWSATERAPAGDTWQELCDSLALMGRAIALPVVDVSTGRAIEERSLSVGSVEVSEEMREMFGEDFLSRLNAP